MTGRLTLIHTAEGHRDTFDALAPASRLFHIVRPDWLERARVGGDRELQRELETAVRTAQGRVLCTCTTLGPIAETAGATRVDWPMMQAAARTEGPVLMAYALESTLVPSAALLERAFQEAGKPLDLTVLDLTELWPLFESGQTDGFADGIAARVALALAQKTFACVVLAQVSMAGAAARIGTRRPVLTSPELALRACLAPVAAR